MHPEKLKKALWLFALALGLLALGYVGYQRISLNAVRAEAKLMVSYIHKLQQAYHIDMGTYVTFSNYYGAADGGMPRCERPDGAEELGFFLPDCDKTPEEGGPRYAFRVTPLDGDQGMDSNSRGYKIWAQAGTDGNGMNYVCHKVGVNDVFVKTNASKLIHETSCD